MISKKKKLSLRQAQIFIRVLFFWRAKDIHQFDRPVKAIMEPVSLTLTIQDKKKRKMKKMKKKKKQKEI